MGDIFGIFLRSDGGRAAHARLEAVGRARHGAPSYADDRVMLWGPQADPADGGVPDTIIGSAKLHNRAEIAHALGIRGLLHDDDAVLRRAFARWGDAACGRIHGDWSAASWDPHARSLVLARDPYGHSALYHQTGNGVFAFATALDDLRALGLAVPVLDELYFGQMLTSWPAYHGPRTIVRSVERRIAAIEYRQKEAALEKAGLGSSKRHASDSPPIEIKIPEGEKRSEYMQVMCDLNILAFQTDTTRVSTYIGSTPNGVSYPELGFNDQHHSQTHHNNDPVMVEKVAKIAEFNIAQFAYMVKKMHGLRQAGGTLLDNCIMMWGSGLEDGNVHTRENLPFIIAGKGGGSIKTGRFLPDVKGNQGDLLTTLLACAGIPIDRPVGIATKQLEEIKA